jgi:hypothetical protein
MLHFGGREFTETLGRIPTKGRLVHRHAVTTGTPCRQDHAGDSRTGLSCDVDTLSDTSLLRHRLARIDVKAKHYFHPYFDPSGSPGLSQSNHY